MYAEKVEGGRPVLAQKTTKNMQKRGGTGIPVVSSFKLI
jgi:hypothetical protein